LRCRSFFVATSPTLPLSTGTGAIPKLRAWYLEQASAYAVCYRFDANRIRPVTAQACCSRPIGDAGGAALACG
jgi:hypothetical protein